MSPRPLDSTAEWLIQQLPDLDDIQARRMFGGQGVYFQDAMFAIVYQGRVYFKVDEQTRPEYQAQGSEPFRPRPSQALKSFYEVPPEVLEDGTQLQVWSRRAAEVAMRAKANR